MENNNNQENRHFFSRMLTRKKKSSSKKDSFTLLKEMIDASDDCFDPLLTFSEKQLSQATNNYDSLHFLHSDHGGGYKWYKGSLEEGQIVSIKKADEDNNNAEWPKLEHAINNIAMAVQMNSQVNSLKIIGICLKPRIPIMVYEFAKNGTLYDYIQNSNETYSDHPFAWKSRLRIASEIATTVAYLHTAFHTPIVHRDIYTWNVFLDSQYVAKLSDFSLSVSLPQRETQAEVEVCGTSRFASPEYFLPTGILTAKSDVFSFGMLLFVLVTGNNKLYEAVHLAQDDQRASSLQDYLKTVIQSDGVILDPRLLEEGGWISIQQQVQAVTELALRCIENNVDERPTMVDVTKQLKQIADSYSLTAFRYNYGQSLRINWGIGQLLSKGKSFSSNKNTDMLVLEKMIESCNVNCDPLRTFSAKELKQSTNNYDSHHLVGKDGFFKWYRGYLDGRYVYYIKKYEENNLDRATIDIVIALHMNTHSNVLKLIGICFETQIPVGVYEFPENGKLSDHIHTSSNEAHPPRYPLLWESRLRIATEIAKTVAYLHTAFCRPIIYGDIKPSHVFLDQYNVAKLSGFDLAIEIPEGEAQVQVQVVCGTVGFMAPEYYMTSSVTVKADVFSFGGILLELLTGRKLLHIISQGNDAYDHLQDCFGYHVHSNKVNKILDPRILEERLGTDVQQQVQAVSWLALRCRDTNVEERPTMVDVAYQLDQIAEGRPQWLALRCTDTNVEERPTMVDVAYQLDQIAEGSPHAPTQDTTYGQSPTDWEVFE